MAARRTCDLRDVGDREPLGVVSRRHQALSHVGCLEVEQPLVFVQGVGKPGDGGWGGGVAMLRQRGRLERHL